MIEWELVKDWLMETGYISTAWSNIQVDSHGIYCSDWLENTFISIFINGGFLVCFVGCLKPKISAGGDTDCVCESHWDVIYYLQDKLDHLFDVLDTKIR